MSRRKERKLGKRKGETRRRKEKGERRKINTVKELTDVAEKGKEK
jgi:hypothetical protein